MTTKTEDLSELGKQALEGAMSKEVKDETEDLAEELSKAQETFELPEDFDLKALLRIEDKLDMGDELTPDEAEVYAIYAQKNARVAQILSRGVTNDKYQRVLETSVPQGRRGKFVRDTEDDIIRHQELGFAFIYSEDANKGPNSDHLNRIRVGDTVLMTISIMDQLVLKKGRNDKVKWKLDAGKREYFEPAEKQEQTTRGIKSFDEGTTKIHKGTGRP
jgi:hypothetical protein